jgi:putative redox protein
MLHTSHKFNIVVNLFFKSGIKITHFMNTSELVYEGDLRCLLEHCYSGTKIITDAPLDNQGKAQSFSPTDLLATSLAACMMTIMGIEARKMNHNISGSTIAIRKIMAANPRRVCEVQLEMVIQSVLPITDEQRSLLEFAAHNCPVAQSLHVDIKQTVNFEYR